MYLRLAGHDGDAVLAALQLLVADERAGMDGHLDAAILAVLHCHLGARGLPPIIQHQQQQRQQQSKKKEPPTRAVTNQPSKKQWRERDVWWVSLVAARAIRQARRGSEAKQSRGVKRRQGWMATGGEVSNKQQRPPISPPSWFLGLYCNLNHPSLRGWMYGCSWGIQMEMDFFLSFFQVVSEQEKKAENFLTQPPHSYCATNHRHSSLPP